MQTKLGMIIFVLSPEGRAGVMPGAAGQFMILRCQKGSQCLQGGRDWEPGVEPEGHTGSFPALMVEEHLPGAVWR